MFDHLPTFHTKILLGDFNAKLGREDNFKLTIGKETLYKDSNDNGVTVCSYSKKFTNKPGTLLIKNSLSDSSCITRDGILKLRSFRDLNLILITQ